MSDENLLEDINLWKRILKDDRNALSLLFRKYYQPLLRYGFRIIPRSELVKDSIQELFYTIWNSRQRLDNIDHVRSYLYASMRRSLFRQAEIEQSRYDRDQSYTLETEQVNMNREQIIIIEEIRREESDKLKKALGALSGRPKEVAFLKFYGGLSTDEICDVMGINKQSVYNYTRRAIASLQESLRISLTG